MENTYHCYANRELSWLRFNERVLEEAEDSRLPLCERLSFLSIFQSNLDEFFMVRIGSLQDQMLLDKNARENKTNMTSGEQIDAALAFIHKLTARRDAAYNGLLEQLAEQGIRLLDFAHMEEESRTELEKLFRQDYLPLLSSFIISKKQAFPFLKNKGIYAVAVLSTKAEKKKIGIVPCGNEIFPRLVPVPGRTGCFILSEELILHFLPLLYKGYKVTSKTLARITRNADIDADLIYDEDLNYRDHMAEVVKKRKKLAPVRLELSREIDEEIIQSLCKNLKLDPKRVFEYDSPLDHSFLFQIEDQLRSHTDLFFAPRHPQPSPALDERKPIIPQILEEDKLIHYPYESIRPFLQLLHEAACDPDVAYLFSRTKFARYRVFDILFMIPFMTPPYIASMGWILFMQKKGLLQQLIPAAAGCEKIFFTLGGLVLVMSLHVFPFMLTMLKNAMLNIPSSLEEAGAVFGTGFSARMRKIFLPLLSGNYAISALLVFVKTLSEYGTPSTLGKRIGFEVFTTEIHRHATVAPIDFGSSATLSSVLVGICLCMWMLQNYITTRKSYNLVSGKGARRVEQSMGKGATVAAWAYIVLVLLIAVGVPYFSVISTSLINLRGYGLAPGNFTIAHYVELFTENEKGLSALKNSVFLAVTSATICAVLGTLLVLAVRKSHSKLRKVVEAIGLLPEMLPGIVLVIGIMLFWNQIYNILPLYNTMGIMVLAYVVLFLPYTVQYVTSSFTQISDSLMAAGQVFGGSPVYILRRITLPLIRQGIATGWMMTFIIAFRELVTASLIAPPNTLVVSTFIVREFEQGSVSVGMAMAVLCVLFSTTALLILNTVIDHRKVH